MDNLKEYIELKLKQFANCPKGLDKNNDFFEGQLIAYHDILDKISEHARRPSNIVRIKETMPQNDWSYPYVGKAFVVRPSASPEFLIVETGEYEGSALLMEHCEFVNKD